MNKQSAPAATSVVPDKQRCALAKAWQELPRELKANPQVEGAFKTGFRLGWCARDERPAPTQKGQNFMKLNHDAAPASDFETQNALRAKLEEFVNRMIHEGGAMVTSDSLSPSEIAISRASNRMFVTHEGFGLHLKPKLWLEQQNERILGRLAYMATMEGNLSGSQSD